MPEPDYSSPTVFERPHVLFEDGQSPVREHGELEQVDMVYCYDSGAVQVMKDGHSVFYPAHHAPVVIGDDPGGDD